MSWLGLGELPECLSASSAGQLLDVTTLQLPQHNGARLLAAVILGSVLYILYYLTCMVNKPRLYGGGAKLKPHLLACCPTLQQRYWPTLWAVNCHMTTLSRFILQRDIDIGYHRTILTMPDGGEVGLDWGEREGAEADMRRDAPILLILAGLTGTSRDTYIKHVAEDGLCAGYRPVVFTQRGTGGLRLKTQRIYCATKIDDLQHVLNFISQSFPQSDVVAVGISLGGMLITQYLHQMGSHSDLKAALVISCPWNVHMTRAHLEGNFFNRLYIKHLCNSMKALIKRNASVVSKQFLNDLPCDMDYVLESTSISQLDERLICPLFGYPSLDDYYAAASNWDKLHKITTPLLCLTATDDPFVPAHSLPVKEFSSNPHTLLVTTSTGGHFGYVEGLLPTSRTWMNRVCREFLVAMTNYKE